jgi:hypothetical protein
MSEMKPKLKKLRLIQLAMIAVIPIFGWVAEFGRGRGSSDWNLRHWFVMGLALWSAFVIEIQCHGKVNVPRMPEFTGEMHLVCDGADNDKVCSERSAMVAERTQISDLSRSEFGHH